MLERPGNHRRGLLRRFGCESKESRGLGHLCEIWVIQAGSKINDAGGLHFQLDKGQRVVLEDNQLDWYLQLPNCEQVASAHGETAAATQRDHSTTTMADLCPNGLRQCIGHRTRSEGPGALSL